VIINPSVTEEVVAERVADLRREAAHQRAGRAVSRHRRRRPARHSETRLLTAVPAQQTGDPQLTDALDVLELCLPSRH
jgi:hypothetical protein